MLEWFSLTFGSLAPINIAFPSIFLWHDIILRHCSMWQQSKTARFSGQRLYLQPDHVHNTTEKYKHRLYLLNTDK